MEMAIGGGNERLTDKRNWLINSLYALMDIRRKSSSSSPWFGNASWELREEDLQTFGDYG
jgi:hypothetical protein